MKAALRRRRRAIPCLLTDDGSLVKTVRFRGRDHIGDPANAIRIFNELEVDELFLLDISATPDGREPNLELVREVAGEAFMPVGYGGGLTEARQAARLVRAGIEKVVVNSAALLRPALITELAQEIGSQAVVVAIDVRTTLLGERRVVSRSASKVHDVRLFDWIDEAQARGAGELLLTSVNREGTWSGFDLAMIRAVAARARVPLVAHGGAGSVDDIRLAVQDGHADAVALGSLVVYQRKGLGVLVGYPERQSLHRALA